MRASGGGVRRATTGISGMTIGVGTQMGKLSLRTWLKVAVGMSVDVNFGSPVEVWSSEVSLILLGLSHGIIAVFLSAPSPTYLDEGTNKTEARQTKGSPQREAGKSRGLMHLLSERGMANLVLVRSYHASEIPGFEGRQPTPVFDSKITMVIK
jgi:hypothetical protein